jgi:hypothetical protein
MERLPTYDLTLIVQNGAGLTMDGGKRPIEDLVLIVRNAGLSSQITFTGMSYRTTHDLCLIARNKVGSVIFAK